MAEGNFFDLYFSNSDGEFKNGLTLKTLFHYDVDFSDYFLSDMKMLDSLWNKVYPNIINSEHGSKNMFYSFQF